MGNELKWLLKGEGGHIFQPSLLKTGPPHLKVGPPYLKVSPPYLNVGPPKYSKTRHNRFVM